MDINYELYKVFYHVAVTLSFSEASKQLFISHVHIPFPGVSGFAVEEICPGAFPGAFLQDNALRGKESRIPLAIQNSPFLLRLTGSIQFAFRFLPFATLFLCIVSAKEKGISWAMLPRPKVSPVGFKTPASKNWGAYVRTSPGGFPEMDSLRIRLYGPSAVPYDHSSR